MARRPHLPLRRLEGELNRRKHGHGGGSGRDHSVHGRELVAQLEEIVGRTAAQAAEADGTVRDPTILLRIRTDGPLSDEALDANDLKVLEQRGDDAIIVLSTDPRLGKLQTKASQYAGPIPERQKGPRHANFFEAVDAFDELDPVDRIGGALVQDGIVTPGDIVDSDQFLLDVELWDIDEELTRELHLDRVERKVREFGGELLSRYRGAGMFVMRVRVSGAGLRELLAMREIAWIDLPPMSDFAPDAGADLVVDQLPRIEGPPGDSICIGIIDSGINAAHPMLAGVVAGAFGVPERLGSDDEKRHGTAVAALASYGSVSGQIRQDRLTPRFRIASAKVVDARGHFVDEHTVPEIMENAIRRLHGEFGCRVMNISLADINRTVGGRPSHWAMTLDNLIRELGIIVTVSAGNIVDVSNRIRDEGAGIYPGYLLEAGHRLYEPASSISSLVVGSLAHSNGLMDSDEEDADVVVLAEAGHPSPFSRSGPGFNDCIKPDLAEYGGTAVWLGYASTLSADRPSCGVLTLNPDYLRGLMEYRHGTSFAAPVAAFKAAVLLEEFPQRSGNFIRALLGLSTDHPPELLARVTSEKGREHYRHAGYGVADVDLALSSEDGRVVMAIEDDLEVDKFAVYEVPIPTDFQTTSGKRHIKVSLAFDPPVRSSRKDYFGITMGYVLVRGKSAEEVFDRFRKWTKDEKEAAGGALKFEGNSWKCEIHPIATMREAGSLQVGTFKAQQDISDYGDRYYLVVRCEGRWAAKLVRRQTFAVAVELWHEADLPIYQQVALVLNA
ncbi:S8 family peptidase [Antarcticirhabdus aurantiaca]|uniref:S8 family peptidase n=1 Tax=Antarcticirhabdus aurantiaca TaxID=2606717 RepID=A0ACD4NIS9_9HYPH|nr:S8 family peptidase [Antarcticirhabdus aurantiaca]WAJ26666.1 S8 family peptidase [Jeongeuplla avenae]